MMVFLFFSVKYMEIRVMMGMVYFVSCEIFLLGVFGRMVLYIFLVNSVFEVINIIELGMSVVRMFVDLISLINYGLKVFIDSFNRVRFVFVFFKLGICRIVVNLVKMINSRMS